MKPDIQNCMKLVSVNVDWMQVFVIIRNVGMKINAGVNVKIHVIKDLFGILVIVIVNFINYVMLENI